MAVGLLRSSVFAPIPEVTEGTPVDPSSGAQFIPLRPGFGMEYQVETLDNDELKGDIGASKPNKGKESVNGTHEAYLKASGAAGVAPELDPLYLSILGGKSVASTEYNTVSSSTVNSVNVDTGEGATFEIGEAVLVKGSSYEIRNISGISTDALAMNFSLENAPGSGVDLGKAVLYKPGSTFQSFSAWLYPGNGFMKEMSSGCQVTELSMDFAVNEYATASFTYQGTKYHFNPIRITIGTNDDIDWTDDDGTAAAVIPAGVYRTPHALAQAIEDAMNAQTTETITVSYSDSSGKFTLSATGAAFSLLWNSGAGTATSVGTTLGFLVAADDTGALTYTSDNAQTYAAPYTPSYDSADPIVCKDMELTFGTQSQNMCVCAQSVSVTITKEVTDADCICEETGTKEKVATGRTVAMEATVIMNKYDAQAVDQLLNNQTISVMLNAGPKSGGNWVAGKCVNIYIKNAAVVGFTRNGEEFVTATITINGFVPSTEAEGKDIYINFV